MTADIPDQFVRLPGYSHPEPSGHRTTVFETVEYGKTYYGWECLTCGAWQLLPERVSLPREVAAEGGVAHSAAALVPVQHPTEEQP